MVRSFDGQQCLSCVLERTNRKWEQLWLVMAEEPWSYSFRIVIIKHYWRWNSYNEQSRPVAQQQLRLSWMQTVHRDLVTHRESVRNWTIARQEIRIRSAINQSISRRQVPRRSRAERSLGAKSCSPNVFDAVDKKSSSELIRVVSMSNGIGSAKPVFTRPMFGAQMLFFDCHDSTNATFESVVF